MKLSDAEKQIRAEKAKGNFMLLEISDSYGRLVVPHADGTAILAALANAEAIKRDYSSSRTVIGPVDEHMVNARLMPRSEYEDIKIAALLGISPDALKEAREQAKNQSKDTTT